MKHYTVTITRQFGSMGRTIAQHLAKELNIEFYDRDIVEKTAQQFQLPVSKISDSEEAASYHFWKRMFPLGTDEQYLQDLIFDAQKDIILDFAAKSSCIIVGRCSDAILEEHDNNFNIYIYAPVEKRVENCIHYLSMTESEARKTIEKVDKAREAYHKRYAGFLPGDAEHKQLVIDSSLLGPEETAVWIAQFLKKYFSL